MSQTYKVYIIITYYAKLLTEWALFAGSFWLVKACLLYWMMMSSGMAMRYHLGRSVMLGEQGDSSLYVALQRSPPTDRCLCLSDHP